MRSRTCWVVARLPATRHEDPVRGRLERVQLAVGADVVDPGVGAGVGQEDEAVLEAERDAIGHGGLSAVARRAKVPAPYPRGTDLWGRSITTSGR
jgi:hypothetical protein